MLVFIPFFFLLLKAAFVFVFVFVPPPSGGFRFRIFHLYRTRFDHPPNRPHKTAQLPAQRRRRHGRFLAGHARQMFVSLMQPRLRVPGGLRHRLGKPSCRASTVRLMRAGVRLFHAASIIALRAIPLPILVIPPCLRVSPDVCSPGHNPR